MIIIIIIIIIRIIILIKNNNKINTLTIGEKKSFKKRHDYVPTPHGPRSNRCRTKSWPHLGGRIGGLPKKFMDSRSHLTYSRRQCCWTVRSAGASTLFRKRKELQIIHVSCSTTGMTSRINYYHMKKILTLSNSAVAAQIHSLDATETRHCTNGSSRG